MYDDDGETYAYEHGRSFSQAVTAKQSGDGTVTVTFAKPIGAYPTTITSYRVRVHGVSAGAATWSGQAVTATAVSGRQVLEVVIPAGPAGTVVVRAAR